MNLLKFESFKNECNENLPKVVDEILSRGKHENHCAIGLITTDDFYGFYVTWDFGDDIDSGKYFEWTPLLRCLMHKQNLSRGTHI